MQTLSYHQIFSRKKKRQIKERETARIANIVILEGIYYSIRDYDHVYLGDSTTHELFIAADNRLERIGHPCMLSFFRFWGPGC